MEYLYGIYLLSGVVKAFLNFFNISLNIDLTLLIGFLLLAGLLCHILIKSVFKYNVKSLISIGFLVLFYIWINITIFYSLSSEYSYQKSFLFLTNVLAFIIPLLYKKFDYQKFLRFFTFVSPVLGVFFLVLYAPIIYSTEDSALAIGGLYLSLPEYCGLCILILIIFKDLFPPIPTWLLLILNALVVILAGGRGPLIFTAFILIIYLSAQYFVKHLVTKARNQKLGLKSMGVKKILLLVFFVGVGLFLSIDFFENIQILVDRSIMRLMLLLDSAQPGMEYTSGRTEQFVFAANAIFDHVRSLIFGYGLGSYSILLGEGEGRGYPHNMILEIWFETGLIGALLFSFFLIQVLRNHFSTNPFVWFVLFLFLNAMKSSSLVDLRLLFGFLALLGLYSKQMFILPRGDICGTEIAKRSGNSKWLIPGSV